MKPESSRKVLATACHLSVPWTAYSRSTSPTNTLHSKNHSLSAFPNIPKMIISFSDRMTISSTKQNQWQRGGTAYRG